MRLNLICPGAQKSGTTFLAQILSQHHNIYMPYEKETHFFSDPSKYKNGLEWYREQYYSSAGDEDILADFTPKYMALKKTPKRIFQTLGDRVIFVFILRDPVERAYSHYWMKRLKGVERRPFEKVVDEELKWLETLDRRRYFIDTQDSYVKRGFYGRQIINFLDVYSPSKISFIKFSELIKNPLDKASTISDEIDCDSTHFSLDDINRHETSVYSSTLMSTISRLKSMVNMTFLYSVFPGFARIAKQKANQIYSYIGKTIDTEWEKPPMDENVSKKLSEIYCKDIEITKSVTQLDLSSWKC